MKECRTIEPLLYLYRDGELPPQEKSKVIEHTRACRRCHEILQQLLSMDAALAPLRESAPALSADAALVSQTMDRITGKSLPERERVPLPRGLTRWLRPALSFAVVAAVAVLVTQQSRDAMKIADLEKHLRSQGNVAMSADSSVNSDALRLLGLAVLAQGKGTSFKSGAMAGNPTQLIGSGLLNLFRRNSGLFDEFSDRYPNLSKITLDDGIDEREKKILATEGKAFIQDFEQLLREGAK
jgi:anti-sigma factor RsiW